MTRHQKRHNGGSFTFASLKFYEKLTSCVHSIKCLFCALERVLISLHFYGFKTQQNCSAERELWPTAGEPITIQRGAFQEVMLLRMLRIPKKSEKKFC